MWYKTGTCGVTNGSTAVTGSGTAWVANAAAGEAIYLPDGNFYEIASVNSDTGITLASSYLGATVSGQSYTILPSQSFIRDLAGQAAILISSYASIASGAGAGKFGDGTLGAPGISFANDTNTGIRLTADGTFRLVSNGVDIAEISPSGLTPVTALILPGATTPAQTAEGSVVWDTDGDLLTIGTGAARKTMVDTDTAQTLTNKILTAPTLTTPTLTLKQSAGPTPTTEGDIQWDTDDNKIKVGDSSGTRAFLDEESDAVIHDRIAALAQYALIRTGVLEKSIDATRNYQTQTGVASVSQSASSEYVRTYPTAAVTFNRPFPDTAYQVHFEVLTGTPTVSFAGDVQANSKATNGFTLAITGSATAASVRWTASYPNAN